MKSSFSLLRNSEVETSVLSLIRTNTVAEPEFEKDGRSIIIETEGSSPFGLTWVIVYIRLVKKKLFSSALASKLNMGLINRG